MAKNIFSLFQGYVPKPKRNVFDLSFNNNFTTKFGQLTPVLCKEVIPGDSIKIDTAAGLRLMPMAFPVQTPMKAYVHYFYVRNRALWKDWQDFITGTKKDLVPPYIAFGDSSKAVQKYDGSEDARKKEFFKVGGNADYFGVPNVIYGKYGSVLPFNVLASFKSLIYETNNHLIEGYFTNFVKSEFAPYMSQSLQGTGDNDVEHYYSVNDIDLVGSLRNTVFGDFDTDYTSGIGTTTWYAGNTDGVSPLQLVGHFESDKLNFNNLQKLDLVLKFYSVIRTNNIYQNTYNRMPIYVAGYDATGRYTFLQSLKGSWEFYFGEDNYHTGAVIGRFNLNDMLGLYSDVVGLDVFMYPLTMYNSHTSTESEPYSGVHTFATAYSSLEIFDDVDLDDFVPYGYFSSLDFTGNGGKESVPIGDGNFSLTPYDDSIKLNALPFRAYECIYNSYYRNMQNNPYILNGETEYNKFIPSKDGGPDYNYYPLHRRNWEYDFMTSSVPSPQFGIAPLVGITMTGAAKFADEDGNTYYAQAELDSDGTITGWSTHSSNMPAGTLRMLMDSVGTGISINDLRNVNSFQRFLENSLRVGLKYRDQIKGHFGVEVRYDELDMPEFIGGMSLDINVNQVTQTADVQESSYPLAGFAGQGGAFGSSNHSVTKYCDEHGFIIGILSVVPVPVYSQLLPKFFLKNEQLDYFFPEFGHIGYQPILQKEISPLQSFYGDGDINKVFGYQRAWYDYIASIDEVHGQFRTTLRDFVMNRTFENEPLLNEDFLLVDPEQVNDVFLSTESGEYSSASDKILGQLYFKITKKSPIPKLGIPRLTD